MRATVRALARAVLWICLPAAAAGQVTRPGELRVPPLPPFDLPQPQRVALDNGMVVILLEDHELPLISVTALVRAGARLDPKDKVGLAEIACDVMRSGGTERMSGDALDEYLEDRAAAIEVTAGESSVTATLSAQKRDFPDLLRVFADVLRRPAFDPGKLELARNQAIANVARQNDDPDSVVARELRKIVYGADSPYARTPTYATLRGIRRASVIAWHKEHVHPDRMVLGLAGDFNSAEALDLVRRAFGDWGRGPRQAPAEIHFRRQPAPGIYFAAKEDMAQSQIVMGHLGVLKSDPDYYALQVLNDVLAGSFSSRLVADIRTRKGLAYSVDGGVRSDWDHPGIASLSMSTKTQTTGAGVAALLEEARGLETQPPTDEEVERARQSILSSFVFNYDAKAKVLGQQLVLELYGYPLDWLARYRAGIEAVTTAAVRTAAARHLHPADFSILVVGPSQGQDRPLSDFGPVTKIDISIPEPRESRPRKN